jgi:hypothetical protein
MEGEDQASVRDGRSSDRRRQAGIILAIAWIVLVTIFLWLQATRYAGLPSILAEWEFDRFGESYPMINYILLVALFSSPALLLLPRRRRRSEITPQRGLVRLVARGRGVLRLLVGLIAGVVLAVLVLVVEITGLPSAYGTPKRIDVAAVGDGYVPEGPTVLVGNLRPDRTALYDQNLLLARRHYRFVPMQPASRGDATLRFFVAIDDTGGAASLAAAPVGILRRASLPGEVARLYRDAGYAVSSSNYVLYPNRSSMYWPFVTPLAQLAVALLVLAIAASLIQRQLRRTRERLVGPLMAS